jgi:ribose transport system ATP-binding protein
MSLLRFDNIAKSFGNVEVLNRIDLSVQGGEVLALVGENGAGKSTLMRIAAGLIKPTSGMLHYQGKPLAGSVAETEQSGIVMVHQDFCLAPHLTVAENVFLGREPTRGLLIDRRAMELASQTILSELGSKVQVKARLRDLPVSEWQMVELAKAFARNPKLILMDEPTSVLSARDAANLFNHIRLFRDKGGSVIFTSHRLDEVKFIAGRIAVLRDGQIVCLEMADQITEHEMAEAMVGRPLSEIYPQRSGRKTGETLLHVTGLTSPGTVHDVDLQIRRGEVLGISGLVGSGRTELFEALLGLKPARRTSFILHGKERPLPSAREAWRLQLAYLTEDRKGKGLLLDKRLAENTALTKGAVSGKAWIDFQAEESDLYIAMDDYDIRAGRRDALVGELSGGNQQKVLIAKTLATHPDLVVFDEPTRGVDIGAKQQIYEIITRLANEDKCVVVISSEMQEIIGLADRVLVMRMGRIAGELTGDKITENEIIRLAMGLREESIHA